MISLQKRLVMSFKLRIGQEMRRFPKVISRNLKMRKILKLATFNFQELFVNTTDLDSNPSWFKKETFLWKVLS